MTTTRFKLLRPGDRIRFRRCDYYVSSVRHDRGWVVVETTGMMTFREHGETELGRYHSPR